MRLEGVKPEMVSKLLEDKELENMQSLSVFHCYVLNLYSRCLPS